MNLGVIYWQPSPFLHCPQFGSQFTFRLGPFICLFGIAGCPKLPQESLPSAARLPATSSDQRPPANNFAECRGQPADAHTAPNSHPPVLSPFAVFV